MNPLNILLFLIATPVIVVTAHRLLLAKLDRNVFLDIPASEANQADVREYARSLYREPVYPTRRSIYEEPTSVN